MKKNAISCFTFTKTYAMTGMIIPVCVDIVDSDEKVTMTAVIERFIQKEDVGLARIPS